MKGGNVDSNANAEEVFDIYLGKCVVVSDRK